ncbi:hypothetical protein NPX13_g6199 [Xylaria arbuscula]|uniref:Ankyrin repeat protein n=1 Tax=Xylaria arbuscula TaxID=114810 RepID=A0A9W8TKL3_9PEZI|nr:hypothetical protein NPX13_g6199 [Xylaria arbuscula]
MGDILMLQGRPCQVIRISTSTATGQHRYLGVDVFNKQLYEESSVVSKLSPDVIVQTMSGPVFKQYRVLDIQNGTVVAMTELGDVKTGLPVLDQSELYSRLSSGFSTSDNVRVLVLSHFGNDMIVDFKVISPPDGRPRLHIAARKGEVSTIQNLLKQQSDIINQLDSVGRTALFDAVEGHHESVVRLLLDSGIRINQVDQRGEVALGIAIVDSGNPTLALLLLEKGASPVAGLPSDVLNLLSAVAAGKVDEVSRLLKAGVAANSRDRLGYTALHEAASRGFFEIVRELIGYGADVNAKTILGRDTVLHTVIERGRNNYQCTGLATGRPSIGEGHVKVVEILLHKGAVPELKRRDGLTVQALILKEFASSHLHDDERGFLREISKTLSIYPSLAKEDIGNVPDLELQEKMDVCNGFHLWIQYHTSRYSNHDKAPVGKFIWNQAGGNWGQGEAVNLETWANDVASEYLVEGTADKNDELPGDSYWRWVHLPANHKTWAKDVIRVLHNNPNIRFDGDLKKLNDFIDRSYYELRGSGSGVCMRRPFFSRSLDPKVVASSIVVPYFDMESLDSYINRGDSQNSHFRKKHALEKIYQRLGDGTMDLHVPCTLDQSYYLSLRDSTERDKTQVVAKYADFAGPDAPGLTATQGREIPKLKRKLLMVNQIWIWKFDSDTLITAFPDRWYQGQETELLSSTVGFMDPPNNGGLDKNLFDIFNEMIAHWANEETQCFNAFYKAQREQKERGEFEARIRDEDICDITKEVRILGEVKDIGDELKMIERVLQDQATVIAQYRASLNDPLPQEEMNRFITLDQDLSSRIYKAQRLTRDALSVENSLNHLLDLKQKQANFNEARDTRRLANEADNRAKSGEEQNQLLFVFTVITVVFTPLSFVTSFLAVPSQDFPQNDTGSGVSWRWWQVFAGSLVTEVIAFVGIALFWVPIWRVLGSGPRSMSISKKFMKNLRVYRDRILGRESHPSEQDLEGR